MQRSKIRRSFHELLIVFALGMLAMPSGVKALDLVKDGQSACTIMIPDNANRWLTTPAEWLGNFGRERYCQPETENRIPQVLTWSQNEGFGLNTPLNFGKIKFK